MPPKAKKGKGKGKKDAKKAVEEEDDGYNIYKELIKAQDRVEEIRVE